MIIITKQLKCIVCGKDIILGQMAQEAFESTQNSDMTFSHIRLGVVHTSTGYVKDLGANCAEILKKGK